MCIFNVELLSGIIDLQVQPRIPLRDVDIVFWILKSKRKGEVNKHLAQEAVEKGGRPKRKIAQVGNSVFVHPCPTYTHSFRLSVQKRVQFDLRGGHVAVVQT